MDATAMFEDDLEKEEREEWFASEDIVPLEQGAHVDMVELDLHVDSLLVRGRRLLQEYMRNKRVYDQRREEMLRELDTWYLHVQHPLERRLNWLDSIIVPLVHHVKMQGKAKSRSLPSGRVGTRATPARVEFSDKKAAVEFCKANALAIKEEPYKKPILKWIAAHRNKLRVAEKAGIVFQDAGQRTFWEVPEHQLLKGKGDGESENADPDE